VVVAMFVAPALPEPVYFAVPPIAATAMAAAMWRHFRPELGATRSVTTASPYRSLGARGTTPTPVAISRVRGNEAIIYAAAEAWAGEFARLNGCVKRAPTLRPSFRDGPVVVTFAALASLLGGLAAWTYQWPFVYVSNGSGKEIIVWIDGEPAWTVAPQR